MSRPSKFHEITHFTQLIIEIFTQCVKERTDALWISLRNIAQRHNDTRTKSGKKRKDAIIIPTFIAVYLT